MELPLSVVKVRQSNCNNSQQAESNMKNDSKLPGSLSTPWVEIK